MGEIMNDNGSASYEDANGGHSLDAFFPKVNVNNNIPQGVPVPSVPVRPRESFADHVKNSDKVTQLNIAYSKYKGIVRRTRIGMGIVLGLTFVLYFVLGWANLFVLAIGSVIVLVHRVNQEAALSKSLGKVMQYEKFVSIAHRMVKNKQ